MTGRPCIFGEVLFDHFPDGQRILGGAPFNVAWHLQAFGLAPRLLSRVGEDPDGSEVLEAMQAWGMDDSGIGVDPQRQTGRVQVSFNNGEPAYDIVPHCAYDAIELRDPVDCDLLYHGSLAAREEISRHTLRQLTDAGSGTIFVDVNLRPPWWRQDTIKQMLEAADWVKLNDEELRLLHPQISRSKTAAQDVLDQYGLSGLILTRGSSGAELIDSEGACHRVSPEADTAVVDTVGAGDAFTSVVILGLLRRWSLQQLLERAQRFASRIVGIRGATTADASFYAPFVEEWQTGP